MSVYPQGGQMCVCGAELQRLGEGERFEVPLTHATLGHRAGIEVEVFRCPTCRRIEFFQVGGGPEAIVRYGG
jgi:hypothetical protein